MVAAAVLGTADRPVVRAQARNVAIHDIQGSSSRSPVEGTVVTTIGIVTGRKSNGFFLQAPDDAGDGRLETSEGIFVFTSSTPPGSLTAGTLVAVTGRVVEFVPAADPTSPPLTEISELSAIDIRGVGARLPAPIEIRSGDLLPHGGHEQLERLESMRVSLGRATMVSPTLGTVTESTATGVSNAVFYVVPDGVSRPFREPGVDVREPLPASAPCCVPRFDGNPERLRVDSDGQPGAAAINAPTGTVLENLVGPLDYGFQSYTVLPDPATPPRVTLPEPAAPARWPASDEFTVASFNLERFFDTTDDPTVGDAVLTEAAFERRLSKASLFIRRLLRLPAIIGFQEIENLSTLRALAAALNQDTRPTRRAPPQYEAYLEEGNDPGGIDVGFLVDRSRVEVLQVTQEGRALTFRPPGGQVDVLHDRPPLVLRARVFAPGDRSLPLTVIVAHMRSLTDIASPTAGARVRAKRAAQAEDLAALVNRRLRDDPGVPILCVGDLNAFEFSDGYVDVVGTMRGVPASRELTVVETRDLLDPDLTNLADGVPPQARYSYVFDGTAQTLDHMLVTGDLLALVRDFTHVRGNADAPEVWRNQPRRPERVSDHDPALVYIRIPEGAPIR